MDRLQCEEYSGKMSKGSMDTSNVTKKPLGNYVVWIVFTMLTILLAAAGLAL